MKPKAYSYVRMSTDIQLKGDSLRRQTEASKRYAEANDLELVEDFKLQDIGVSAFHGRNVAQGALGKFLALAENGSIDKGSYLLVESLDRISRQNPQAATTLFLQILQAGINIVTLTDGHVYRSGSADFTDIIVSVVIMSRAYEESRTKSLRVGAAWENKRKNLEMVKLTRIAPVWLRLSEDRSRFDLIDDRVEVVRKVFADADAGRGSFQIARALNLNGTPTFSHAKGWHESYVSKVLTNRAVIGEFQPHKMVDGRRTPFGQAVIDYFPSVISAEQFERVQRGRSSRRIRGAGRKGTDYTNVFSGVAKCGYCAGTIVVVNKGRGPKGAMYIRCDNARRGAGCDASNWPIAHFEAAFFLFVHELDVASIIADPAARDRQRSLEALIASTQAELNSATLLRERAFRLLDEASNATSYVSAKIEEATARIDELHKILADQAAELRNLGVDRERSVIDVKHAIETLQDVHSTPPDARAKIADWIRQNVRELLVYADGLEGDPGRANRVKIRQFSVLFETGAFRTVQTLGANPASSVYSVFADDDGVALMEQGVETRYDDTLS